MLPATGFNQFFVSPVKKVKMALRAFWHSTVWSRQQESSYTTLKTTTIAIAQFSAQL